MLRTDMRPTKYIHNVFLIILLVQNLGRHLTSRKLIFRGGTHLIILLHVLYVHFVQLSKFTAILGGGGTAVAILWTAR